MKKIICILVGLLAVQAIWAEVKLNSLFTDNMVLQRNQPVPVWGTADPGEQVSVSFLTQRKIVTADASGNWMVVLEPMKAASSPRELIISASGNSAIQLSNILVGDVWLCTGQSNMQQVMRLYLLWESVKDSFSNDQIRFFKMKEGGVGKPSPSKELITDPFFKSSWQPCTPEFAAAFSATAGFFGRRLQQEIGVPIGLISANRGGTRANMWIPRAVMEQKMIYDPFLDASNPEWKETARNPGSIRAPAHLYNGTIHPLAPFAIKGAIWYQGESDALFSDIYTEMMTDLVSAWRADWGFDFPFLFVQLAPWDRVGWDGEFKEGWAWQREAQFQCLETIPNSGMVVITDAGEAEDIHPQAKNLPGERLAVLAASLDDDKIDADFPILDKTVRVKNGKALVKFEGVSGGLKTQRVAMNLKRGALPGEGGDAVVAEVDDLKGFTVCGADGNFVEASAKIVSRDTVLIWSDEVKQPVAVRYGWANFPVCNLFGGNDMPASPGRTDDFSKPNLTGEKITTDFSGVQPGWGSEMELLNAGDGTFKIREVSGLQACVADENYLYAKTAAEKPSAASVHVVYFDDGFGTLQLRYDSTSDEIYAGNRPGIWKPGGEVKLKNSQLWKVALFDLPDGKFSKRCNGGDLRLQSTGRLTVSGIYIWEN